MAESGLTYGSEVGSLGAKENKSVNADESQTQSRILDRKSTLQITRNEEIRRIMDAEQSILKRIEIKTLKPLGKRKRAKRRRSRNDTILEAMRTRDLEDEDP